MPFVILAGDIGGTKAVLAVFDGAMRVVRETVYACADYPSLEALLDGFLDKGELIEAACLGVAGPVVDGVAKITNLPWTVAVRSVSARLGEVPVSLLNDLQATALGTLVLPDAAFAVLQTPGAPRAANATIGVIAPGTGLGEAVLISNGTSYQALPSEGGHADFAATTDEELELVRYLRRLHGVHVSWERVLSGGGIADLYGFVRQRTGVPEPAWLADNIAKGDRNAAITAAALAKTDAACVRVLELFAELLGAEAGNLALRAVATGGVVIGGGIAPKLLPAFQTGATIARFNAKGRFSSWNRTLGVRVALEPRAALLGAAHEAAASANRRA